MRPSTGDLRDKDPFERLDQGRLELVDPIVVTQLSMLTPTKGIQVSIFRDDSRMKATARDLTGTFPNHTLDQLRRMTIAFGGMPQSPKLAFPKGIQLSIFRDERRVKATGRNLGYPLVGEPLEQTRRVLMTFNLPMPRDSILLVAPGIKRSRTSDNGRVSGAAGNLRDRLSDEALHPLGRGVANFVAVAQLSVEPPTPGEQIAIAGDGRRVVGAAGDLDHDLSGQGLREARHVLPAIVAVAQSSVVAAAPGVDFSFCRQDDRVTTPAGNLLHAPKGVHVRGLVLVAGVAEAELAVFAAAPREDGELGGFAEGAARVAAAATVVLGVEHGVVVVVVVVQLLQSTSNEECWCSVKATQQRVTEAACDMRHVAATLWRGKKFLPPPPQ